MPKITINWAKNKISRSKDKISEYVRKLLLRKGAPKLSNQATETRWEKSIIAFTEDDFIKFENEYFFN